VRDAPGEEGRRARAAAKLAPAAHEGDVAVDHDEELVLALVDVDRGLRALRHEGLEHRQGPGRVRASHPIVKPPDELPQTSIGKLLADTYLAAVKILDRRLRTAGFPDVRPSHGTAFQVISADGSRVTDLAARAGMTKQAMTELVAHLERAGYLDRGPDPADGRARLVRLTPKGWECTAARAIVGQIEAEWTELIGQRRMAGLRAGLEALSDAVGDGPSAPGSAPAD